MYDVEKINELNEFLCLYSWFIYTQWQQLKQSDTADKKIMSV